MMSKEFATTEGKEWIRSVLFQNEVTVTFTKKDGEVREMRCTLNEDIMKKNAMEDQFAVKDVGRKYSDDAQSVFDLDKLGWRAFRFDSITGIKFTIG